MAEWSKAPDSRKSFLRSQWDLEISGPLMWAWVRIPLLTLFSSIKIIFNNEKTKLRQRGIEPRSTAWKATMLTITPLTPLAFLGHKTRTNVIQILLTKAHHLSVLSFTVVIYCHFKSFAYWCNGKNILMTTKFYWHRSKCVIKEYSRLSCSIDCYNMNQKSFQLRKIYHFLLLWRLN